MVSTKITLLFNWIFLICITNVISFSGFPSRNPLSYSPSPFFYEGAPPHSPRWGSLWMAFPSVSAPNFVSVFPPVNILYIKIHYMCFAFILWFLVLCVNASICVSGSTCVSYTFTFDLFYVHVFLLSSSGRFVLILSYFIIFLRNIHF